MTLTDAYHGDTIDCLIFARYYSIVVVLYNCSQNPKQCLTSIFSCVEDGAAKITIKEGIDPTLVAPNPGVLQIV